MMRPSFAIGAGGLLLTSLFYASSARADTTERLTAAAETVEALTKIPESDKGIPQNLIKKARCIVVVPSLKSAALGIGGEYGKGFVSCRNGSGWTAPAAVKIEGGSFGFQIGGSETEVVMLVMNEKGMNRLLSNKFTLGADATIAAGPVGRSAEAATDAAMTAEILSYSRSRGLFAGVSLKGATLRPDEGRPQGVVREAGDESRDSQRKGRSPRVGRAAQDRPEPPVATLQLWRRGFSPAFRRQF